MHRTGRSIGAFGTGLLLQLSSLGIGLLATPLLLKWLGDERYGAFRVASDWVGYIGLLELGVSGSLMALLAQAIGQGNQNQIRLTLAVGIRAYLQVTAVMLLAGFGFGCFITQLVQVKGSLVNELQTGYWLGLLGVLLVPLSPFRRLADASQRSHLVNTLMLLQSLLITGTGLLFAWSGFGIPGQYAAVLIGTIFFYCLICRDGLRQYPTIFTAVFTDKIEGDIQRRLWQLNLPTLVLFLAVQVSVLTDNIVISYYLGPALVVPFFVTQRLAVLTQTQIQAVGNATWAALADLHSKGEHQTFNVRLVELTQLVTILAIAFMVTIAAYNPYFVKLWVGQARYIGDLVSVLAATNGILLGLFSLWTWCFIGTGQINKIMLPIVLTAIANLVISLAGTQLFGIVGPLLGTFCASIGISAWWLPRQLQQVFGTSIQQLFLAVVKPLALGLPYALLVGWLARNNPPEEWLSLGAVMGLSTLFYLVIAWFGVLSAVERSQWHDRLIGVLPKLTR